MKYASLTLAVGLIPVAVLSAPPERCDDNPPSRTFPQSPSTRAILPSQDLYPSLAGASRRQRLQNLKDRVNKLKLTLDCPQPTTTSESRPTSPVEPPVVEKNMPPVVPPLVVEQESSPSVSDHSEPDPPAQSVPASELAPLPVAVPVPEPVAEPVPEPMPPQEREPSPPPTPEPSPEPTLQPPLPVVPEAQIESVPQETVDPAPPESPRPLPPVPEQAVPIPTPAPAPSPAPVDVPPTDEGSPLALPTELLDQAIDRQRMGNNLYAIGAYELALMNYEKMLKQPLGQIETQWVNFQVANCQRHLGQTSEAQKTYRRVAAETSEEWLGQMSRWWLKELDDRDQLQRRVVELDQIITTLEQELNRAP